MGEKKEIRVKFEIGEIKFEAEGSADLVAGAAIFQQYGAVYLAFYR